MKTFPITPIFLFLTSVLFGQTSSIQTYYNDSEPWITEIYHYPGDPTSLVAVNQTYNGSNFVYQLVIPAVGSANPVVISGCTEVTSTLHEVASGALFSGKFVNQGNELFFYNGLNPTVFDLNPGNGSSDPQIFQLNDGLFITAFDGLARQLYEFVSPTQIKKVTNELTDVYLPVGKINNDYLYQMSAETSSTQVDWKLNCARENAGSFTYSTVRTTTFPIISGNPSATPEEVNWVRGMNGNGQFTIIEEVLQYQGSAKDFYVVKYDESSQGVSVVDQSLNHGNAAFAELFEFENDICWYVSGMTSIKRSINGTNFNVDVNSESGANETILQSYISEDGVLWTIRDLPVTGESLIGYANGQLNPTVNGNHLHFSLENQSKLYLTDFSIDVNAHYLHVLDLNAGTVESVFIDSSNFHSPTERASLMLNGVFTFLYERIDGQYSIDILQLNSGDLGVNSIEESAFLLYPNPSNGTFSVAHNLNQPRLKIYNLLGEIVYESTVQNGQEIELTACSNGAYIAELTNEQTKIRSKIQVHH